MLSLKQILTEGTDVLDLGNLGDPDLDLLNFTDGRYTYLIYYDIIDKIKQWAAFDFFKNKIISSSDGFLRDLYEKPDGVNKEHIYDRLNTIGGDFPSHSALRSILYDTDRILSGNNSIMDGQLFESDGKWYFPFWQMNQNVELNKNRSVIDDFLREINVKTSVLYFEDENSDGIFYSYDEIFNTVNVEKKPESSDEQRRMKQLARDLHINKGVLDKAIVQALQSRPKDVNTLYQRLEKQFGMPIVKIKHLFGAIPLDKLIAKKAKELVNESMFPKDFDRHSLGSCMMAASMATDYLLSKGRKDFKVIEGWVSLDKGQSEEDFSPHTWIQFDNGKIFDPTKKQWSKWGFDPNEVEFKQVKKSYTPKEYQSVCQRYPDDVSKFKKMAEATMINDDIPEKLYHATYRPLLDEISSEGIIPGGKDTQNFDWAGKFVYLAETAENAVSFVEVSENEDIPEEWADDIVVLEVDVSKLDLTKMAPDENWNPDVGDDDEGYRSFQYEGVISPQAIKVL